MRFRDDLAWSDQELELKADDTGRRFLAFFIEWFTVAENVWDDQTRAADWVRQALVATENKLGYLSMEWIGQMLLLASQHWIFGDLLTESLTVIELRLLEQMAAVKLVELQESAKV